MIKAIIFDLGGVMIINPQTKMFGYLASVLKTDETELKKTYKKYESKFSKDEISEKKLWELISKDLKIKIPKYDKSLWLSAFLKVYKKRGKMFNLVHGLKSAGYKTALLSNTEKPVAGFIRSEKYSDFDAFIFSCEIGLVKPEKGIYEYALKKLKIKSSEALFIDDKEENIEGAEKLGIKGILFQNEKELEKTLKNKFNLKW